MTDKKGKVKHKQKYEYDSFGNMKQNGNKIKQSYTYTGREYDRETGLYYYRARYYDSTVGRFTTEDPIGFEGGINFYSYVGNNPINWVDPKGLEIRVYSSDAFGIPGLNHAFVYSTVSNQFKGTNGSSGINLGNGGGNLNSPYFVVPLPSGMSEATFMDQIESASGWNNWLWIPWANDCHSDLENAFNQTGVPYPGSPNGRVDIDDIYKNFMYQQKSPFNSPEYINIIFGGY